jgi:hypothetical protein
MANELERGVPYERSDAHTTEWYRDQLSAHMEDRLSGAVTLRIERMDEGSPIEAPLVEVSGDLLILDFGAGEERDVHCKNIAVLTVLPERDDQSDEVGRT